jgi:hypothetical protein
MGTLFAFPVVKKNDMVIISLITFKKVKMERKSIGLPVI